MFRRSRPAWRKPDLASNEAPARIVRRLLVVLLALSGALVFAAGYPWGDYVAHSHWTRVEWIPFQSGRVRPLDLAGNLLLGVPFGVIAGMRLARAPLIAGAVTLIVAVLVEAVQVYSHYRFPSATDVVCNVTGAVTAAALMRRYGLPARQRPA